MSFSLSAFLAFMNINFQFYLISMEFITNRIKWMCSSSLNVVLKLVRPALEIVIKYINKKKNVEMIIELIDWVFDLVLRVRKRDEHMKQVNLCDFTEYNNYRGRDNVPKSHTHTKIDLCICQKKKEINKYMRLLLISYHIL